MYRQSVRNIVAYAKGQREKNVSIKDFSIDLDRKITCFTFQINLESASCPFSSRYYHCNKHFCLTVLELHKLLKTVASHCFLFDVISVQSSIEFIEDKAIPVGEHANAAYYEKRMYGFELGDQFYEYKPFSKTGKEVKKYLTMDYPLRSSMSIEYPSTFRFAVDIQLPPTVKEQQQLNKQKMLEELRLMPPFPSSNFPGGTEYREAELRFNKP